MKAKKPVFWVVDCPCYVTSISDKKSEIRSEGEMVSYCPSCDTIEDPRNLAVEEEDLKAVPPKVLAKIWKAIGKLIDPAIRKDWAQNEMKLRGNEKRKIVKKLEAWAERVGLDYYVDTDQMWSDIIILRSPGDGLPLVIHNMVSGWEPFVPGEEVMTEEELELLREALNGQKTDPL